MPNDEPIGILLVEDNPGDARLVEVLLSDADLSGSFNIVHAATLGEALERLEESNSEVILLDLSLPDSSGLETVNRMRAAASEMPIVVLSGQDDEQIALQTLKNGAEDYLVKGRGDGELVARSVRYSIERKSAEVTLRQREKRLEELVGKLITAQEEERRRVAYEVHDGLAQMLAAAYQRLQAFAQRHTPASETGREDLDRVLRLVRQTVGEARRVIANLRPTALDDLGLAAAIRREIEALRGDGWEVEYEEKLGEGRIPSTLETTLFRVTHEALTNARKHARTDRACVELRRREDTITLTVEDRGRGFDPSALDGRNGPGERVGLSGMQERVGMVGGELEVRSRPKEGTSITVRVPLPKQGGRENRAPATSLGDGT